MKCSGLVIAAICAGFVGIGCASAPPKVTSIAPSNDELPDMPRLKRSIPARVGVQGQNNAPRLTLVAPMPPVEPTEEERKILKQREPAPPQELVLNRPEPGPEDGVYPRVGGILAGTSPSRGASHAGLGPATRVGQAATVGSGAGLLAGTELRAKRIGGIAAQPRSRASVGQPGGVRTGEGPVSRIADHQRVETP